MQRAKLFSGALTWLLLTLFTVPVAIAQTESLAELGGQLASAKLRKVPPILQQLEQQGGVKVLPLFEAMLAGQLYTSRADKALLILGDEKGNDTGIFAISDAFTGETRTPVTKTSLKKIKVNNKLRKELRRAIARMTLFSDDPKLRESAVSNMLQNLNDENIVLLEKAAAQETSPRVSKKIELALNIVKLDSVNDTQRLAAIDALRNSVEPAVRNRLQQLLEQDAEGNYIEGNSSIVIAAEQALRNIDSKLSFYGFLERVFFGLSLGSVLLLAAIGLSITFGVMGVINMAHGELLMLGAYTTYVIQLLMPNHIGVSVFVAIPAAFIVCGLVGIAIERGVIQFLKGRPLETLLATFGISLILQQTVRSIFSPLNRQVSTPEWMSGALEINAGLSITYNRLYIIIFSLFVFTLLLLVMKKTALGLYVRAVSQNRDMAKAVGIRSEWVDAMTFGLGSGIAGVAGVALSQLTNVGPNLGQAYIIDSFMVVVFGGVGNLWGTLVAAFSLGTFSKFMEPLTGTVLAQIFVLVFIVLFIQKRPQGLFPQKGRAAE
ncbi:MAG: urea ABC transporter permease subunit UrtB [Pseudomonadales bacterium]|nr:urea ABC transporter permease subunit UrtB [Gammaproteobacteria bacterium]NNL57532.1 urea ABC transporter permease subunit UrtB [Pseudomonadales bacterium]